MNHSGSTADASSVPSRRPRWLLPAAGLAVAAVIGAPVFVATTNDRGPSENSPSVSGRDAVQLGPLASPVLGTGPAAFTDGRNHFVVEFPGELVAATGSGTLVGDGTRTALPDLSVLTGAEEIVTDADSRTWVRHPGRESTSIVSADVPAVLDELPRTDVVRVDASHFAITTDLDADALRSVPGVTAVRDDQAATLAGTNDQYFGHQWALENRGDRYVAQPGDATAGADMRGTAAWRASRGRDVVVAVIDTGVDFSHPDLAGAAWNNPGEVCGNGVDDEGNGFVDDCHGWDFYRNDSSVYSAGDHPHGTNVSGVIAATTANGIGIAGAAPEAKIMALQVSNTSSLSFATASAAINYAVANGADVINASWGGGGYTQELLTAVNRARDAGIVMAIASGNNGVNTDAQPFYPAAFSHSNIVSVGASTPSDGRASFSNYGATTVDLFAPGYYTLTTSPGNQYSYVSGTSFSAPYTAGALALMLARDPTLSPPAARDRLVETATRLSAFAGRSVSGGRLDAEAATAAVVLPVSHSFAGFDALDDLGQTGAVHTVATPGALPTAALGYRVTLATRVNGAAVGVASEPIAYTLPNGSSGVTQTDESGEALLSADSGFDSGAITGGAPLGVSTELPGGSYALVVELLDLASLTAVGRPHAVVYDVAYTGGNDTPPDPTPPPTAPPTTAPPATTPPTTSAPVPVTAPPATAVPAPAPTAPPATAPPGTTPPAPVPPAAPTTAPPSAPTTTAPGPAPVPAPTTPPTSSAPLPSVPIPPAPPVTSAPDPAPAPTGPPATIPLPPIPATPVNLDGTAAVASVALSWAAGAGPTPTGYRVWRDGQLAAQTIDTEIAFDNLENDRGYTFAVSAYSLGGESARTGPIVLTPSASLGSTTTLAPEPPVTEPAPTSTAAPAPPPTDAPAPPSEPGSFDVVPDHGPDTGGTRVSISAAEVGEDADAVVIGGQAQRIEHQFGSTIAITTRPHAAGTFDVEIVLPGQRRMVLPAAFTFEGAPAPSVPPTSTPATSPVTSPPAPAPTAPPVTAPPVTAPPVSAPTPPSPAPTSPPATSPPATSPPATSPPATGPGAPPRQLPTGDITPGKPLTGLPTGMWDAVVCRRSPCAGIVL